MILPISNCFQLETEGSFPHANLHQAQKENLHVKRPKDLPSLPHQIPTLTPKPTPISTRPPSIQLSSPDQPHETATKGRTKDAKLLEQKNEGGSRLEWEGRKQEDRLSAQLLSKVHLVRQIELQISLLQSKSKQPGTKTHNLQSLGYQIYDKIDNYYIHYGIYHNKSKLSTHFQTSLLNKTGYEAAGGEVRGRKTTHRNSVAFSEAQDLEQEQGVEIRKVLKTTENLDISVSSATETQKVDDQMHIFETKLTESQLAGLDKPLRSSFEGEGQGELAKESQFQLKESIRVMQERIVFLIHRLEQTKSEVSDLKEENVELQTKLRKQTDWGRELKGEHQFLCLLHQKNLEETERLQKMVESAKNKHREFAETIIRHEKEISEQKEEIESCHSELAEKQSKIGKIQAALWLKNQEYAQLASAYRGFEEEKETRKTELVAKLQESEDEKSRLRQTIKQYKFRLQTQGLSFKFEQAHRLKQLFEESSAIHQRDIQKIEGQYSKTIQNLKQTLQQSISSRKQLQSALVQSLGLKRYSALDQPEYTFSEKGFRQATASSHLTDFTCEQLSKEFVNFVQRYKIAETELQNQKQKIEKYEYRMQILKEECQERFMANKELSSNLAGKSEQIQELNKEIEQLKRYLRQNLASFGKSKKSSQPPSVRTSKIQSKIIQINFAKQTPSDLSELTLQSFIKKRVLSTPKNILKFILKLISFSQQLQCSHRRKLPSLAPHSILLSVKKLQDLDISFSIISKKEQEQGLIYQAPQILLGFSQSSQSHCWTIGVILDQMLTNRKFFKSFSDILSHKDNYTILDDSFKNLEVLHQMIRKSHKQRITLDQAKRKLQLVCNAYP